MESVFISLEHGQLYALIVPQTRECLVEFLRHRVLRSNFRIAFDEIGILLIDVSMVNKDGLSMKR